jgi:WD40 repeat protein
VAIAFDENLSRYARLADDGRVTSYRVGDDKVIARWKEPGARIVSGDERPAWFSRDSRYLAVWYGRPGRLVVLRLNDLELEPAVCFRAEDCRNGEADFTPDSTHLAYLMTDSRIAIVDLTSREIRHLAPIDAEQAVLDIAPDGRRFAITTKRNGRYMVEIRELESGKISASLPHPGFASARRGWHPDGRMVATTCHDRLIRLWDARSGKLVRTLEGHKSADTWCAFDTTGQWLVSNDWDGILRLWEVSSGRQLLSFLAGGYPMIRVGSGGLVPAMKCDDITKLQLLRLHGSSVYRSLVVDVPRNEESFAFGAHPEGGLFLIQSSDHTLNVVDSASGQEVANLPVAHGQPLLWEPAGALVTAGDWGLVRWPVHSAPETPQLYQFGPPERLLANPGVPGWWQASASGQTILVPDGKYGAVVVHLGPPQRRVFVPPLWETRSFALSPDGRWVATGGHGILDGIGARVWDAATGQLVKALPLPPFCTVSFSPDGRRLLTTGGGCRLWPVGTWTEAAEIGGASGVFSPDGRLLAVEEPVGALRLVDTASGADVLRLEAPEQTRLRPVHFTLDGTNLVAFGTDTRALHIWDLKALRAGLVDLKLDWDPVVFASPLSSHRIAAREQRSEPPVRVSVNLGELSWAVPASAEDGRCCNNQAWAFACRRDRQGCNPDRVVQLAQKAVDLAPGRATFWNTLGVAQYRARRWQNAIESLNRSMTLAKGESESFNTLFLAMAHWQLGNNEKAHRFYDQALRWMSANRPIDEELRQFRTEAADLLGRTDPSR